MEQEPEQVMQLSSQASPLPWRSEMRRKRAWEIGATAALLLVVGLVAVNGYSWHLRQKKLNASLAAVLDEQPASESAPVIRRLLSQGADIRTRGPIGETVLKAAAQADDLSLAKQALDAGVPVDEAGPAMCALLVAVRNGSSEMVELLLARGAVADERYAEKNGMTPLMWAAYWCQPTTTRTLLSAGADPSLRDDAGRAALEYARARRSLLIGRAETIRLLKEALARKRSGGA